MSNLAEVNQGEDGMNGIESVSNPMAGGLESLTVHRATPASPGIDPGHSRAAEQLLRRSPRPSQGDGDLGLESVIGVDERTRVLETEMHPWRMICSLVLHGQENQRAVGTGWFAGPNTVITAGHCVHHSMLGGWASSIEIRPGRNEVDEPFGVIQSRRFTSVRRWVDDGDADYDFAAIHLDEPIGDRTGYFSVLDIPDDDLHGLQINVSGYPADLGRGRRQWFHSKNVLRVAPRRVYYDVDTFGGQSGAPAWVYLDGEDPDSPRAVAVHAYGVGGTPNSFHIEANSAPRLSGPVFDLVQEWIESDA